MTSRSPALARLLRSLGRSGAPLVLLAVTVAAATAEPSARARSLRGGDVARFHLQAGAGAPGFDLQGEDDGRFGSASGALALLHDSTQPGARLSAPLGFVLDGTTSFSVEVAFEIVNLEASPTDFFQIAFGLCHSERTGLNRTGTSAPPPVFFVDDSDAHDAIEFAYFPNVTAFGGPTLQPSVFGADVGGSIFANFAANFGPSADLGDNGPDEIRELPLGRSLRAVMDYDACTEQLVTRVFEERRAGLVELATGLLPVDVSFVNDTATFEVDSFAVHAYQDLADFDPSSRSFLADLRFHEAIVTGHAPLAASWLVGAAPPRGRAPRLLRVDGVAPEASVRLVDVEGDPVDVVLQVRARPRGAAIVEVPAEHATADSLVLEVGGCRVTPAAALRVPGEGRP